MKTFLVAVLFFTAFAAYVNGQGQTAAGAPDSGGNPSGANVSDGGGDAPDANVPDAEAIPEKNMPDADVSVDAKGGIDIEGIKCLCNLQVSANTDGNAEASASGGGDCGLGDPAPTLSINCDAVLNGKVDGAFFYILEIQRNSMYGQSSFVRFNQSGYEITALNWPKGLSKDNDMTIFAGGLAPDNAWKDRIFDLENENPSKLSLCNNDQTPGSFEYNLIEMSNQLLLDGRGCPLEKDAKTSIVPNPPQSLPPAIYQFPKMLPCQRMSWHVKVNDPDNREAFQVWYDFTPVGLCKPSAPKT